MPRHGITGGTPNPTRDVHPVVAVTRLCNDRIFHPLQRDVASEGLWDLRVFNNRRALNAQHKCVHVPGDAEPISDLRVISFELLDRHE